MLQRLALIGVAFLTCLAAAQAAPDEADGRLLDELIGKQVSNQGAPGAAAVLVRSDGRVTLRAYGMADMAGQRAVDAQTTVFRIGSLSKTFTALAVMQLVDEGKIDLEADANRYLKGVQIPLRGAPVRVLDLLTHRGGFDGDLSFVGLNDALVAAQSSDQRLQRDIIPVRAPGALPSYDNMAWGLLGQIVESVDGVPYEQAIQRRIFKPLGMNRSRVGLPADLAQVATAYEIGSDGKPHALPQIYLRRGWRSAGDLSTTAGDMALFLQAMLAQTAYPGGRLLKAETFARQIDTTHFGFHPALRSTGLGVYALGQTQGGGFGHGGTIRGFNASMVVFPRQELAVFAVMNLNIAAPEMSLPGLIDYLSNPPGHSALDPTDYMTIDLPYLLEQRLQPAAPAAVAAVSGAAPEPDWSGRYAGLRMESYEALLPRLAVALLLPTKNVRVQADGSLYVNATGPYRQRASGLYSLDGPAGPLTQTLGFARLGDTVVMGPHTLQASRRLAWYERAGLTAGGLLLAPLLLLLVALLHARKADRRQRAVDLTGAGASLYVLFAVAAEIALATRLQRLENLGWVVALWRAGVALALLALLAAAFAALLRAFAAPTQFAGAQRAPGRVYSATMALLASWAVFAALYWHLAGRIFS